MAAFDTDTQREPIARENGAGLTPPSAYALIWGKDRWVQILRKSGIADDLIEGDVQPPNQLRLWFQRSLISAPLPIGQNKPGKLWVNLNFGNGWEPVTSQLFSQYIMRRGGAISQADLDAEIARAMTAEAALQAAINAEMARAIAAENLERQQRIATDLLLQAGIDSLTTGTGGGLLQVTHDTTLLGKGTVAEPLKLNNTAVTPGSYGNVTTNKLARITVDAHGLVTAAEEQALPPIGVPAAVDSIGSYVAAVLVFNGIEDVGITGTTYVMVGANGYLKLAPQAPFFNITVGTWRCHGITGAVAGDNAFRSLFVRIA